MSKQPPSSGRFGHPALDKIIQGLAKQAAQADATHKASALPTHPALTGLNELAHMLSPNAQVSHEKTWDEMLYEATTRQREEWMARQGVTGLTEHGAFRTSQQRNAMSPWPLR